MSGARFLEDVPEGVGAEDPAAPGFGNRGDDALFLQQADGAPDGVVGEVQFRFGPTLRDERVGAEQVQHLERNAGVGPGGQRAPPRFEPAVDALGPAQGVLGLAGHAVEEEVWPCFNRTAIGETSGFGVSVGSWVSKGLLPKPRILANSSNDELSAFHGGGGSTSSLNDGQTGECRV